MGFEVDFVLLFLYSCVLVSLVPDYALNCFLVLKTLFF